MYTLISCFYIFHPVPGVSEDSCRETHMYYRTLEECKQNENDIKYETMRQTLRCYQPTPKFVPAQ